MTSHMTLPKSKVVLRLFQKLFQRDLPWILSGSFFLIKTAEVRDGSLSCFCLCGGLLALCITDFI